jgi:glucokinase
MPGFCIGVDVGGTKIAAGVVDPAGTVQARRILSTHAGQPPGGVIEVIRQAVEAVTRQAGLNEADLAAVGVGFPGHTHGAQGRVLECSNLPDWDNYPLRDHLRALLGLPVILDNDCNCAAWGEYCLGAGRGSRYMGYVTFSTGFGAGIVLDGRLYAGATGTAGELGHTVVDPDGPACGCGRRGCVMSYASGQAISRMVCERIRAGEPTLLHPSGAAVPTHVSGEAVADAAQQGDALAGEVLAIAGRYFGFGLVTLVQVLNPDRIVIGGGLTRIGPLLMDPCLEALRAHVHPAILQATQIVPSGLGADAGMLGAAALAWQDVRDRQAQDQRG